MSRINENITDAEHRSREKKTQYMKENYAQLKVYVPKEDAEAFDAYCKANGFKKADIVREMINAELKSAKRSDGGIGRIGKLVLGKEQGDA